MNRRAVDRMLGRIEVEAERIPALRPSRKVPADGFLVVLPRDGESVERCLERNGLTASEVQGCMLMVFEGGCEPMSDAFRAAIEPGPAGGIVC